MSGADAVTLRLPTRLDAASLRSLRDAAEAAPPGATVVLRGGSEDVFCEGLDLSSLQGVDPARRAAGLNDFRAVIGVLLASNRPSVACVTGRALGGGLGLAAACDVVLAAPDSRFGLPEPLFGLIPGLITPVIKLRAGAPAIRRIAISGESIDAAEAQAVGLVDEIVDPRDMDARVGRWVRRFSRAYPPAVGRLKRWLRDMDGLEAQLEVGVQHMMELLDDPGVARRIRRFADGLAPWEEDSA